MSWFLLANFRRSLDNVMADSRQALGLHDDLLGKFRQASLASSETSQLISTELTTNSRTPNEITSLTPRLHFASCLVIIVNHAHVKTHFDLDN